ncbi:MAG: ribonuclease III [Acidobacteriota bacterium]
MYEDLEKKLNYTFRNRNLLTEALTHTSYNEGKKKNRVNDNERLEFLGDSVINLVITDYLFKKFGKLHEGDLSKLKAHLVSSGFLNNLARSIEMNTYILLGKGEEKNGGRENVRIIASLFEAIAGAVYLDSNFKATSAVLIRFFETFLDQHLEKNIKINDYKSELQEVIQKDGSPLPEYVLLEESGKPPDTQFKSAVYVNKKKMGEGKGKSKRQSEQGAAFDALLKIGDFADYKKISEVFFIKND